MFAWRLSNSEPIFEGLLPLSHIPTQQSITTCEISWVPRIPLWWNSPPFRFRGSALKSLPVVDESRLRQLLDPFGLNLEPAQVKQVLAYLHLLLRWNEKINLTAIRDPEECVTRHFGESLFIARHLELRGELLDIGSGAGFPGLALKVVFPEVSVTLLEPVAKKRAFLKEAARVCGFRNVAVRAERLENLADTAPGPRFDFATARAVGNLKSLVPLASQLLEPLGSLILWLTHDQADGLAPISANLQWAAPVPIPLSRAGVVCRGTLRPSAD